MRISSTPIATRATPEKRSPSIWWPATGSELDPYVVLMKADGTRIAENDDISPGVIQDSALAATLPEDGTYIVVATRFLEAEGFTAGDYELTVGPSAALEVAPPEQTAQQPGVTLAYGETVSGRLDDTHYEDRWTFEGQHGDLIAAGHEPHGR